MRLSADLIQKCNQYLNPCDEFYIDLRSYRIQVLENLTATNDQFGCIDLSNNEIEKIEIMPKLERLCTLMINNNKIHQISPNFCDDCPRMQNLMLANNSLISMEQVEIIAKSCPNLVRLSLHGNIVSNLPNYRLYSIHLLPKLRVLDFQKVTEKERAEAQKLFGESAKETEAYKSIQKVENEYVKNR